MVRRKQELGDMPSASEEKIAVNSERGEEFFFLRIEKKTRWRDVRQIVVNLSKCVTCLYTIALHGEALVLPVLLLFFFFRKKISLAT